jgi:Tfp pilus assembly protein PilP
MMLESKHFIYFIILACTLFLSACSDDARKRQLHRYIAQLKQMTAQKQNSNKTTIIQLPKPTIYQPGDNSGNANRNNFDKGLVTNPLQTYSLKALQFVGTLTQDNRISAYVMTPDNMIYLVKDGDVIGDSYGKILKIDSEHIEILEKSTAADNKIVEHVVTMELKD